MLDGVYAMTFFIIKISILLLYYRLFKIDRLSRILIHFGIIANVLIVIPSLGVAIARTVQCTGMLALVVTICSSKANITVTIFGLFNTVMDFYTLAIPVFRVQTLRLDRKRKWAVIAIFMTGLM
jgi:hypothetical protein